MAVMIMMILLGIILLASEIFGIYSIINGDSWFYQCVIIPIIILMLLGLGWNMLNYDLIREYILEKSYINSIKMKDSIKQIVEENINYPESELSYKIVKEMKNIKHISKDSVVTYEEDYIDIYVYRENGKIYVAYSYEEIVEKKVIFPIKFKINKDGTIEVDENKDCGVSES